MAEKLNIGKSSLAVDEILKPQIDFNKAMFEFGLKLVDDYNAGRCRDSGKLLEAIIKIFEVQPKAVFRDI